MESIETLVDRYVQFYGGILAIDEINSKKVGIREDSAGKYIHIPKPKRSGSEVKVYFTEEEEKIHLSVYTGSKIPKELPDYYIVEKLGTSKKDTKAKVTRTCSSKSFPRELERLISTFVWIEYAAHNG